MDDSNALTKTLDYFLADSKAKGFLPNPSDKSTFALLANFKRVLYPLELNILKNSSSISSLVRLCCEKVILDVVLLKKLLVKVPIHSYDILVTLALDNDDYDTVEILMIAWPYAVFPVSKVVTNIFNDWDNLINDEKKFQALKKIITKFIRCLMIFLDNVKRGSLLRLRVLDLRGMPMGDRVMRYLADELLSLPSDAKFEKYHIIIDSAIYTCGTFKKLKKYLISDNIKLHLHFNKLDLRQLSDSKSRIFLKKVNPIDLVGLCFRSNFFKPSIFASVFHRFPKLTALEISSPFDEQSTRIRCDFLPLELLPNLRRLAFCGPTFKLYEVVPQSSLQKLEYLDLTENVKTVWKPDDLKYMPFFPLQFSAINLSGHVFVQRQMTFWNSLLGSSVSTLTILELEKCLITESKFSHLLRCILLLVNLRFLNLGNNYIRMRTLRHHAKSLRVLSKLETIRLPYVDEELTQITTPVDPPAEFYRQEIEIILVEMSSLTQVIWGPYLGLSV